MGKLNIYIPHPSEKQAMLLSDTHRYVAYGGARGGGKSWGIDTKCILLAAKYPRITQTIVRHTYPQLNDNHIKPLKKRLPVGSYRYSDKNKELVFPNGSIVNFRYCANDKDLDNFQGTETDILYIDEATQFTEYQFRAMDASRRSVENFPSRTYLTCNPGGIGHAWVKRLFIDRRFNSDERAEDYSFIQAFVQDNKALMEAQPEYIHQLEALPPKKKAAWLEGRWDVFEGQFFEEFTDDPEHYADGRWTHVIEPFDVSQRNMKIYRSYDFGYQKPFSCAWWAVSQDDVVYRILELYGCTKEPNEGVRWTPEEQFDKISQIENEHPWLKGRVIHGVADPSIWDGSRGISTAEKAEKRGVYFEPGINARIPGWMQCHYRMTFDKNGYPSMYVFNTCKAFLRTIPMLCYSETVPEDLDTRQEDHVADEWRYFLMSRPIKPPVASKKPEYSPDIDPLNQISSRGVKLFERL